MFTLKHLPALIGMAFAAGTACAADSNFSNFSALPSSVPVGSLPESAPFQLGNSAWTQRSIADRATQIAAGQANSGNWDMIAANETGPNSGRYLFSPFETGSAGVQRIDRQTGITQTIVQPGTQGFVSGDASRWTPWGTYLTAEESWGTGSTKGRLFEVTNPLAADPASVNFIQRSIIPRVSHEGLAFDKSGSLYFIDELNGGSIYKYVSATPNAGSFFDKGQTFVMRVGDGNSFGATGAASWVAITDTDGNALAGAVTVTINGQVSVDGRATTNLAQFKGTDYDRPEDLEIQTRADGNQLLYFTATGTHNVYSINLSDASNPNVMQFAGRSTLDQATGLAVGNSFTSPDNLAVDADGNMYIVEDQPGGQADIWFARDLDRDGVAESIGRWATMSTAGAEPTGLYFDKFNPNLAYVNIQHPASGNDRTIEISAVPEPETYALMLAGLGVIGAVARRRRSS